MPIDIDPSNRAGHIIPDDGRRRGQEGRRRARVQARGRDSRLHFVGPGAGAAIEQARDNREFYGEPYALRELV